MPNGQQTNFIEVIFMKTAKIFTAFVLAAALAVVFVLPVMAADATYTYTAEAQKLHDLGLYNGISSTSFDPDLGTALDRQTGVVMLLRLFGKDAEANAMSDAVADAVLSKFSDAGSIAGWAKKSVAYAVVNGLVGGLPDGTFGPTLNMNGKMYATLIMRQLGYTPDYSNAPAELADKGGLTSDQAKVLSDKALNKDDLVGISYSSLSAVDAQGNKVIENLIAAGDVDAKTAAECGLLGQVSYDAAQAVNAYLAAPITTLPEVSAAETLGNTASQKVTLVTNPVLKAELEAMIAARKAKVAAARTSLTPPPPPAVPQGGGHN